MTPLIHIHVGALPPVTFGSMAASIGIGVAAAAFGYFVGVPLFVVGTIAIVAWAFVYLHGWSL